MPPQIDPSNPSIVILDEDSMVMLPGSSVPVKSSDVIGFQSAFTKKMQGLSAQQSALEQATAQAEQAQEFVQSLNADPVGALDRLRKEARTWAETNGEDLPDWITNDMTPTTTPTTVTPPSAPATTQLEKMLNERLGAMEAFVSQFAAGNAAEREFGDIKQKHPELYADKAFLSQVAEVTQRIPQARLEDAHKVAFHDLLLLQRDQLQAELKQVRRDNLGSTPSLGFGTSTFGSKPKLPPKDAFREEWEKLADEALDQ